MKSTCFLFLALAACETDYLAAGRATDASARDASNATFDMLARDRAVDADLSSADAAANDLAEVTCAPSDVPSSRTISFDLHNDTAHDRYVVSDGWFCTPFAIVDDATGAEVPLSLGFQCGCECPNPGAAKASSYHRVAPGEHFSITWDARRLVTCSEQLSCGPGTSLPYTVSSLVDGHVAAAAASYRARFGIADAPPPDCAAAANGDYVCTAGFGTMPFTVSPPPVATACASASVVEQVFSLPASGDLIIGVSL